VVRDEEADQHGDKREDGDQPSATPEVLEDPDRSFHLSVDLTRYR